YGNWFYDQYYGWMWSPDYNWAPAWVTWGDYDGNYCWAPIGPRVSFGISYRPPIYCWTFVPHGYITNANVSRYYVSHVNNTTIVNNITVINNVNTVGGRGYVRGPQPQNVERFTHSPVRAVAIQTTNSPGRGRIANGQLAIYRPTVNRNGGGTPAPSHVQDYHNLRQSSLPGRNSAIRQETFAASHASSPIRPASTGGNGTNNNPATNPAVHNNASNNNRSTMPVHRTNPSTNNSADNNVVRSPVHRTNASTNNPANNNVVRNKPVTNNAIRPNNNQPANRQPAVREQQVRPNNNQPHTIPNRQPAPQRRPVQPEHPVNPQPKGDHH
ncbi:MAG TPA: DUF6600 domain-containing protein, partial [Puia sp.]|nr:DUF6600 domain-containing protein [Puia sp.]